MRIEGESGELIFQNNVGDTIIIPKTHRAKALKYLEQGNYKAIDAIAENLPYMEDYAEDGTLIPSIPDEDPTKVVPSTPKALYRSSASKGAPFVKNWVENPETKKRLKEQLGTDVSPEMVKNIDKVRLYDMTVLKGLTNPQIQDEANEYNAISKEGPNTVKNLRRMKEMATDYTPATETTEEKGIRGVSMINEGSNFIGTEYPVLNPDITGTATHELTHATGKDKTLGEYILNTWKDKILPEEDVKKSQYYQDPSKLEYYKRPGEIYSRVMQLRQQLNLTPGQQISKESLQKEDKKGKYSPLHGLRNNFDDDTIIDILNKVAKTDQNIDLPIV